MRIDGGVFYKCCKIWPGRCLSPLSIRKINRPGFLYVMISDIITDYIQVLKTKFKPVESGGGKAFKTRDLLIQLEQHYGEIGEDNVHLLSSGLKAAGFVQGMNDDAEMCWWMDVL